MPFQTSILLWYANSSMQKRLIGPEQEELILKTNPNKTNKKGGHAANNPANSPKQSNEPLKDLDNIKPISHSVPAKPHTPVYKMHRYFARRPWSVFNELIRHYSNPGSIVLDPFCGGGVTIIEGLKLRRKVIGVDLNPMATFITRMEAIDVDLSELEKAFQKIEAAVKDEIKELYLTKCPKCGKETPADWFEWCYVYKCPKCGKNVPVAEVEKTGPGTYRCKNSNCSHLLSITNSQRVGEKITGVGIRCAFCHRKVVRKPIQSDEKKADEYISNFGKIVKRKRLWYPKDQMAANLELRRPYNKEFKLYTDFFTRRNLLAAALLFQEIQKIKKKEVKEIFEGVLISTLNWAVRMCVLKKGTPAGWAAANFWTPQNPLEINVWKSFKNRFVATLKGKEYSKEAVGNYYRQAGNLQKLLDRETCLLTTRSATGLLLPDCSVDVIVTDPPYGGNVMYTELSNFYLVWIKKTVGLEKDALISDEEEAVISRPHKKGLKEYRHLMYRIFKECYRVLKPGRWMTMTFHNREFKVWNALHLAAHDAGFILSEEDGMIYQPPIQQYVTTIYQFRGGSMLGDFILSFKKVEKPPEKKVIPYVEVGRRIEQLASEAVLYHHGATLSTIYMKLIPFLLNKGLLEKIDEKGVIPYLQKNFEERGGKWQLKEKLDIKLEEHLSEYSRMHYKEDFRVLDFVPVQARVEYLVKSYLYKHGKATMDEILTRIFTNLINSDIADYEEINKVLNRLCEQVPQKGGRKVWRLKEDIDRQRTFDQLQKQVKEETVKTYEESEHDLVIKKLVDLGAKEGYGCHIGQTEQRKYTEFQEISTVPLAHPEEYGLTKAAFKYIKEIDLLWFKGDAIVAAFEVERSTTIVSGIDRFRNLFVAQPNTNIESFLVVPDSREKEVQQKINSPANRKENISTKVGYILFSDLEAKSGVENISLPKIKRKAT